MAETGPQKYLAFRAQTEAVGNFITDFQAHIFNDRSSNEEKSRIYVENIKKVQDVQTEPYASDFLSGVCVAEGYNTLDVANQIVFQGITGLS